MTAQQMRAIAKAIASNKDVSIGSTEMTVGNEGVSFHETRSLKEINRLFASDDFKLGWSMAHTALASTIEWILIANNDDLVKYAGRAKRPARKGGGA